MRAFFLMVLVLAVVPVVSAADAEGCRDPAVLQRLPGCTIHECRTRDYDEAELQSGPVDASGDFPKALVDGELAVVSYACPASLRLADIARQAQAALRRAGFSFVHAGGMLHSDLPGFTARRGTTWVQLVSEPLGADSGYTVTMVRGGDAGGRPRRRPATRRVPD